MPFYLFDCLSVDLLLSVYLPIYLTPYLPTCLLATYSLCMAGLSLQYSKLEALNPNPKINPRWSGGQGRSRALLVAEAGFSA